jgi:Phage envelope protein
VNTQACPELTQKAAKRIFSGKSSYEQFYNELAQAGVFKWVVDLNNQTRFYWSKDNQLLHSENIFTPIREIEMAV